MNKIVVLILLLLVGVIFSLAMPVRVQNAQFLKEVNYTFNLTKNSDCSNVKLSDAQTLWTNSFGGAETEINTNRMLDNPDWLCVYNNNSLERIENVSGYDFRKELLKRPQAFSAWSNTTSNEINTTPLPIPYDVEVRDDYFFNHRKTGDNANITVKYAGEYLVQHDTSLGILLGNSTTVSQCWLEKNGNELEGTKTFAQHRNEANGENSHHMTRLVKLEKSDKVQVVCKSLGSATFKTVRGGSRITLEFVRDET